MPAKSYSPSACLFFVVMPRIVSPKAPSLRDSEREEKHIFRRSVTSSYPRVSRIRIELRRNEIFRRRRVQIQTLSLLVYVRNVTRLCIPKAPATRTEKIPCTFRKQRLLQSRIQRRYSTSTIVLYYRWKIKRKVYKRVG